MGQPSVEELYGFCATYLEQRLEERTAEDESEEIPKKPSLEPQNSFERNIAEITRQSVQSATLDHSLDQNPNPNKVKKMLRREGTFSIYDSGKSSSQRF